MSYAIALSADARRHIRYLLRQGVMSRGEHNRLINAISSRLAHQPAVAKGSVKALHEPNPLNVSYELRVQPWRAFYTIDEFSHTVRVEAVGYKPRERLFIEGQEVEL